MSINIPTDKEYLSGLLKYYAGQHGCTAPEDIETWITLTAGLCPSATANEIGAVSVMDKAFIALCITGDEDKVFSEYEKAASTNLAVYDDNTVKKIFGSDNLTENEKLLRLRFKGILNGYKWPDKTGDFIDMCADMCPPRAVRLCNIRSRVDRAYATLKDFQFYINIEDCAFHKQLYTNMANKWLDYSWIVDILVPKTDEVAQRIVDNGILKFDGVTVKYDEESTFGWRVYDAHSYDDLSSWIRFVLESQGELSDLQKQATFYALCALQSAPLSPELMRVTTDSLVLDNEDDQRDPDMQPRARLVKFIRKYIPDFHCSDQECVLLSFLSPRCFFEGNYDVYDRAFMYTYMWRVKAANKVYTLRELSLLTDESELRTRLINDLNIVRKVDPMEIDSLIAHYARKCNKQTAQTFGVDTELQKAFVSFSLRRMCPYYRYIYFLEHDAGSIPYHPLNSNLVDMGLWPIHSH